MAISATHWTRAIISRCSHSGICNAWLRASARWAAEDNSVSVANSAETRGSKRSGGSGVQANSGLSTQCGFFLPIATRLNGGGLYRLVAFVPVVNPGTDD